MPSIPATKASGESTETLTAVSGDDRSRRTGRVAEFSRDMAAGALMGGAVHTVVAPIERAKLLLQTQESNDALIRGPAARRFRGMVDCIARTVRDEGFFSLWRGNGTSVVRYYPSAALNFSLKDLYKSMIRGGEAANHSPFSSVATANFMAGAAAGCTTLVIIYPLDIAHTRLAADIGRTDARQFRGMSHFLQTIYKKDGFRGIYRGLPASIHGMIVHRGIYFGGYDTAKDSLISEESALWKRWVAAQVTSTTAGLVSYPLDTVRRRMMMQSGSGKVVYHSTLDCWKKIYMTEGLTSFYRGALSNIFRSTGAAAVLVLFDEIKKFLKFGGL